MVLLADVEAVRGLLPAYEQTRVVFGPWLLRLLLKLQLLFPPLILAGWVLCSGSGGILTADLDRVAAAAVVRRQMLI